MDEELKPNTGAYWKKQGNSNFEKGNYDQAIKDYSKAIELDDSQSIYYSNRGRCFKISLDYKNALKDAYQALELDSTNIKAHLLCGQCLAHISKFEEDYNNSCEKLTNAIKRMTKALSLCTSHAGDSEKAKQYERELSIYIMRAKKLLWYQQEEHLRMKKNEEIQNYKKYMWCFYNFQLLNTIQDQDKQEQKINRFIEILGDPDKKIIMNIPDYLLCHITLDLIEDPVTLESGLTYERSVIEEHIQKNGNIEPVTRQQISGQLFPNLNIKKGIQDFLALNPWAFEFKYDENKLDIKF